MEETNRLELVLGTNGRSGEQWDIWQAVYSPVGADGYPKPIWDKRTGVIDKDVAAYWREHYDLTAILKRDWDKGLGKKLEGKLHIFVGEADNYFLNNAVVLAEDVLKSVKNPPSGGVVDYEPRAEHCWNGDHTRPNAISRLRYHQMFLPQIVERSGRRRRPARTSSWDYSGEQRPGRRGRSRTGSAGSPTAAAAVAQQVRRREDVVACLGST